MSSVGWAGGQLSVGEAEKPPAALMDRPMMSPTHQGQIGQIRRTTVQPVPQMMRLTPGQRPRTAREHTATITHRQGGPLGGPNDPAGPTDLQRLGRRTPKDRGQQRHRRPQPVRQALVAVAVAAVAGGLAGDQDPGQGAVTSQPATPLRRQRPRPANLPPEAPRVAEEAVQVHHDRQLRPHPTGLGQPPTLQSPAGQLSQRIRPALPTTPAIRSINRAGQRRQCRQHNLTRLRLQQPINGDHPLQGGASHNPRRPCRNSLWRSAAAGSATRQR